MFGYHVPEPDEAMLISGRKGKSDGGQMLPFRIVTGSGAFVLPVVNRVSFLSLAMQEATVEEPCFTQQGIMIGVHAVIAFKVGNDEDAIAAAARRFLNDNGSQMTALVGRIFAGHLRSIVGSMTVEDIIREQQKLGENILNASKLEMGNLGLVVDSLQISQIDDQGSGYIDQLSAPHRAQATQAAQIAQAQASQASAEAQQKSAQAQAEYARDTQLAQAQYARDTAMKQAEYEAETSAKQQEAAQAGPLAAAQATQAVLVEQALVAQRQAELTEAQLVTQIVKPAEAEAQRVRVAAQAAADQVKLAAGAEAESIKVKAAAAATEGRISLDQLLIQSLPQIVTAAAQGLQGANLTVLNGTEGVGELLSQLTTQGLTILNTVRSSLAGTGVLEVESGAKK